MLVVAAVEISSSADDLPVVESPDVAVEIDQMDGVQLGEYNQTNILFRENSNIVDDSKATYCSPTTTNTGSGEIIIYFKEKDND